MRQPTRRTAPAAVLIALVVSLLPAPAARAQSIPAYQRQARVVTNDKRADHDVAALKKKACLQKFARRHARDMAALDLVFHQDLSLVLEGCDLTDAAENVAFDYATGRAAVRSWMKSPAHRAKLLDPSYQLVGIAVRTSDAGTPYAVQVFGQG